MQMARTPVPLVPRYPSMAPVRLIRTGPSSPTPGTSVTEEPAPGATPSHIYTAASNYTVTLTVTDNGGATGSATSTATISAAPGAAPASPSPTPNGGPRATGDRECRVRVSETGRINLYNAFVPSRRYSPRPTAGRRFSFNVNGKNLNPVPCRVRVEQPNVPGGPLCGEADVANAPATARRSRRWKRRLLVVTPTPPRSVTRSRSRPHGCPEYSTTTSVACRR